MFTTRKSSAPSLRAKVSFAQMLPLFTLAALADGLPQYPVRFYERLWCPLVTLWSMVWQRLQADDTMAAVVQNLRRGGADALVRHRTPPSQAIRSRATTGFSAARRRLSLAWVADRLAALARQLLQPIQGLQWHGLDVRLLDGSTIRLRPLGGDSQGLRRARQPTHATVWVLDAGRGSLLSGQRPGGGRDGGRAESERTSAGGTIATGARRASLPCCGESRVFPLSAGTLMVPGLLP